MSDQIDVNQLSNALQQKVDLPSGKSQADVDYVVEFKLPTSSDPTWYRLYKSGWVEQGGRILETSYANVTSTIVYLKEMSDTNYNMSAISISQTSSYPTVDFRSYSTTGCTINRNNSYGLTWRVEGMSAQS